VLDQSKVDRVLPGRSGGSHHELRHRAGGDGKASAALSGTAEATADEGFTSR
jgi:hypothetical protein